MPTETLEEKVARLEGELTTARQERDAIRTGSATALKNSQDKIDVLQKENDGLKKKYDELVQESTEEITRISTELDKTKKIADVAEPTITVNKVDYQVLGKNFIWKQREYTVAELLKNKALQETLVKAGAGFLVKK